MCDKSHMRTPAGQSKKILLRPQVILSHPAKVVNRKKYFSKNEKIFKKVLQFFKRYAIIPVVGL